MLYYFFTNYSYCKTAFQNNFTERSFSSSSRGGFGGGMSSQYVKPYSKENESSSFHSGHGSSSYRGRGRGRDGGGYEDRFSEPTPRPLLSNPDDILSVLGPDAKLALTKALVASVLKTVRNVLILI